jgi:excisionase family DNA binding protein
MVEQLDGSATLMEMRDVAKRLKVSLPRAYELGRQKLIPVVRVGRQIRVDPAALEAWIRQGGNPGESVER